MTPLSDRDRRRRHRRPSLSGHRRGARAAAARCPIAVVTFAGTARGIEARVVPREGFELDLLRSAGLKGTSPAALVARARRCCRSAALDAWRILSKRRPDLVHRGRRLQLGAGGADRGAARHSDDAARAERGAGPDQPAAGARWCRAAAVTFDIDGVILRKEGLCRRQPDPSGVLRRQRRVSWPRRRRQRRTPPRVLIFGGSQGAHAINMAMVEAAPRLADGAAAWPFTHQTGERDLESRSRRIPAGRTATRGSSRSSTRWIGR